MEGYKESGGPKRPSGPEIALKTTVLAEVDGKAARLRLEADRQVVNTIAGTDLVSAELQNSPDEVSAILKKLGDRVLDDYRRRGLTLKGLKGLTFLSQGASCASSAARVVRLTTLNNEVLAKLTEFPVVDLREGPDSPGYRERRRTANTETTRALAEHRIARLVIVITICGESDACQCCFCEDITITINCW